jgi:RimJ/RimL family protein N-acetyltransferase
VRLRTKVTKGAGSAAAALAMVLKLVESAQARWRSVNAPHLASHGHLPEIAWVVGTPWQGRGIATEVARGLVDWLSRVTDGIR